MSEELDLSSVGRDLIVIGVSFNDGLIEIQYMEKRDQAETAGLLKNLVTRVTDHEDQVDAILDEVEEIIDNALLIIRNPEKSFDPRKRLAVKNEEEG